MADLNSTLNTLIPVILVLIAVGWVWYKFGEPLSKFFSWLRDKFATGASAARNKTTQYTPGELVYR